MCVVIFKLLFITPPCIKDKIIPSVIKLTLVSHYISRSHGSLPYRSRENPDAKSTQQGGRRATVQEQYGLREESFEK